MDNSIAKQVADLTKYEAGFVTDIESDKAPKGLNEDIIRFISAKKNEPEWLLEWRLKAYEHWKKMPEPDWAKIHHPPIDYQDSYYYSAPKPKLNSMDEVDPELLATFEKLGVPMKERAALAGVAVDVCSIPCRWQHRLRKILQNSGLFSVQFPMPCKIIQTLSKKIWGQLFHFMTINMRA